MSSPSAESELDYEVVYGLRARLETILDEAQSSGSFFTSGVLESGVLPGLEIPGVGEVRLPISPDEARAICQTCCVSPTEKAAKP